MLARCPPRAEACWWVGRTPRFTSWSALHPTPMQEGIVVTLQWLASAKVSGRISDLTDAFDQARKTSRQNKLATKLPPRVTHPAVEPGQLLLVETEIYGLLSGPSWLRASLTVDLLAAGYVKNPYDKCLFTLFSSDDTSEGQLLLDVDDFIEGGKEAHRKAMEGFYAKYCCGRAVDLMSTGQEVHSSPGGESCRITITASPFLRTNTSGPSFHPIEVPKSICQIPRKSVRRCSRR